MTAGSFRVRTGSPRDTGPAGGMLQWAKANAIGGLSDADPVSTWPDSSGNGYAFTQSGAPRPTYRTNVLNGLPVVRFVSASSTWMDSADVHGAEGAGLTILVVAKQTALATAQTIVSKFDYPTQDSWQVGTDDVANNDEVKMHTADVVTGDGSKNQTSTNADLTTTFYVLTFVFDGSQGTPANRVKIYRNGTLLTTSMLGTLPASLAHATSTVKLGRSGGDLTRYYNGDIAEYLLYGSALSADNRQQTERYLGTKYGLTVA